MRENHTPAGRQAALLLADKTPPSDTLLFFLLNQAVPDGTFPLSIWIYLVYPPAKNPKESVGKIALSHSSEAGVIWLQR